MQATQTQTGWLDRVGVASPCSESWDGMTGDDRVRACARCEMNVYNLSGMRREEAEALVQQAEGRLCVTFLRRPDGTVLTADCPTGLAAARRRMLLLAGGVCSVLLGLVGWAFSALASANSRGTAVPNKSRTALQKMLSPWMDDEPERLMGEICIVPTPQPAPEVPIEIDYAAHE